MPIAVTRLAGLACLPLLHKAGGLIAAPGPLVEGGDHQLKSVKPQIVKGKPCHPFDQRTSNPLPARLRGHGDSAQLPKIVQGKQVQLSMANHLAAGTDCGEKMAMSSGAGGMPAQLGRVEREGEVRPCPLEQLIRR